MKATHILIAAATVLFQGSAFGGTVTIVQDLSGGTSGSTGGWLAVTWTQTGSYNNVSIGANLAISNGLSTGTGTAYLVTALGPSATPANLLATDSITVSGNPGVNTMTSLFTGLSLGPGTYYLLVNPTDINMPDSLDWDGGGTPAQTLDTGVTQQADRMLSGTVASPPYDSANIASTSSVSHLFSVTGTPVVGVVGNSGVPEPGTMGLMALGLGGLGVFLRRQRVSLPR
jgi:hypothetical protein